VIKLNLGCGIFYKPGYVNIDLVEDKIADEIADVTNLPYEENSVDIIEASHIIEHFDVNQIPFILSEWYRVLKPGGIIEIETPNLIKSVWKLRFSSYRKKILTLKFLFGVDYRGNIHKIGFTSSFLKKNLFRIGFVKIKRKKQRSFKGEKGMRFQAIKPIETDRSKKKHLITSFRSKVNSYFKEEDTLFYEVLENNCFLSLFDILPEDTQDFLNADRIRNISASLVTIHPELAVIFLELFPVSITKNINKEALNYLAEIQLQSLLMSDWIKWKKYPFDFLNSIAAFYNHWIKKLDLILSIDSDYKEMLSYLTSLEKKSIRFFAIEIINIHSLRLTNQGIKAFNKGELDDAKGFLEESLLMNPSNIEAILNLARLFHHLEYDHEEISILYDIALKNLPDRKMKGEIKKEHRNIIQNHEKKIKLGPIQLRR
jgi:SAM-dependent methyltransferase